MTTTNYYVQRTGNMYQGSPDGGSVIFTPPAYSGGNKGADPEGVNNPAMENLHNIGPIPRGGYTIGVPFRHPHLGPDTMILTPDESNNMFGRSLFRIHGDNDAANQSASDGCIVKSPAAARIKVYETGDRHLTVVAEESDLPWNIVNNGTGGHDA